MSPIGAALGIVAVVAAAAALVAAFLVLRALREIGALRLRAEQGIAGERSEAEMTRRVLSTETAERIASLRGALDAGIEQVRTILTREQGELRLALADGQRRTGEELRTVLEARLKELREGNEAKLAEIQRTVNEQLHSAVEKQMTESFARVIDQFAAVQKAMGDVQAVTAQIGDLKRLFSNVKTRGGWGEAQLRALLDDILPPGSYETNFHPRGDSDEAVEFALRMPVRGETPPLLPIDAKFPVENYERLIAAAEAGDIEAERAAQKRLERAVREQAKKIASKYICPPRTVEFAVMYLPTDGLFAEVARLPGLIDDIGRDCRVLVLGPSLLPAMLRTIQLGFVTLALEQKADQVRELLGATRTEMLRMDEVLGKLAKNAGAMTSTIEKARQRTRVVQRKLREVEMVDAVRTQEVLEIEAEADEEEAA
ncbi:MAG TPA: DNA recombination protein RmuC [Acetobacteraceae bacterium]|nr:DNA recombination protein RmuC [Acetobacteraceae bacterium]